MLRSNVHLLDLPNEILLLILKKLDNIDVLCSLSDINNERLDVLAQQKIFTNILNFVPALTDDVYLIPASILDRFCCDILPRVHYNVKCLILDSVHITRILLAADYPCLEDCLSLLDGRLKQLSTLIIIVYGTQNHSMLDQNMVDVSNLKCFSLTYKRIEAYDAQVVPLLRRMSHLEELTLYLCIYNRSIFVDGTHLYNEILIHMPQLRTFIFYIRTKIDIGNSIHQLPVNDIQQTFNKIQCQEVGCILNYNSVTSICHVFSLPFSFDCLEWIGNTFPNITFNHVTFLKVFDSVAFKHEFFIRVARSFPLLKEFFVINCTSQFLFWKRKNLQFQDYQSYSIVEFSHLTSLNISHAEIDYVEQFLNSTKTSLPCLTKLE
ncbi:unnamed protein product, partial [Rotaria socialis]